MPSNAPPAFREVPECALRAKAIVCVNHPDGLAEADCPRCHRTLCAECAAAQARNVRCCPACRRIIRSHPSRWNDLGGRLMTQCAWLAFILSISGCVLLLIVPSVGAVAIQFGMLLAVGILFTICAVLALKETSHGILAVLRLPYRLFFESRIHLVDLIFLVALLGNGVGILIDSLRGDDFFFAAAACIGWVFYVLAAAIWGLWVSQHLKFERSVQRCGLIVLGMVAIPGVLGVFAAIVGLAHGLDTFAGGSPGGACLIIGCSGVALASCLFLAGLAAHFHLLARRHGAWRW